MRKSIQVLFTFAAVGLLATIITGCSAKSRAARHERHADKYFDSGEYAKAEVEYLNALQLNNDNAHTIGRLGEIYFNQGRFGTSYRYLKKASEMVTNDMRLHVKLGTIYLNKRMNKEAHEEAALVLDSSPTNSDGPDIFVSSVTTRAELDQARKRLEKLSKQIGDTASLEVAFGVLDLGDGDLKGGEAAFKRALTLDPKNGAAYSALGNLYNSLNRTNEADVAFKAAADYSPVRSLRRLNYANFKIKNGDLVEGKRLMVEINKEAPDYIPAWLRQAEIASAEKKFDDCESLLKQVLTRDQDNYDALLMEGRMYLAEGQSDKAIAGMDRMAALYERSPEVQYYLAIANLTGGDQTRAASALNKALFLQPRYPEAIVLLANLNMRKGDLSAAISSLSQLIHDRPGIAEAYLLLANAYVLQKNLDKALTTYSQMAEYFPQTPQVPLLSGMIFERQKKSAEARKAFEKALELSPRLLVAQEELVNLDIADNQFTTALARVSREMGQQPGLGVQLLLAKIHIARAEYLMRQEAKPNTPPRKLADVPAAQEDINQAEAELAKAIDFSPSLPTPYLLLAQLYVSSGKQQAALDRLNALVDKTNNVAAYMQIGMIYDTLKNYPAARDAYEKVLATNPDFSPALNNLSYLYSERLGQPDKGLELAEKAHQLSPGDPSSGDTLGWAIYKKGDYSRALSLLADSASKVNGQPEIQFHLGMANYMLGNEGSARIALQQAASSTSDFPGKEEAARHLAIMAIDAKTADAKTRADLEKRLNDEPNDPVVANRLGGIYERDGSLDKAAKTYEQTLKQNPQSGQIMARLTRIYVALNDPKALEMAKQAHKFLPDDAATSCLLGRMAFQSGDYTWALSLLQEAAPRVPNQIDAQYDLAWAYYAMGRVSDAEKTMQGAIPALTGVRLDDAKWFVAMIAAAKAPTQTTAAQAAQVLGSNSNYVPAIMVSAVQAERQAKQDDARRLYERALARYPGFMPAARNLAILYAQHPGDEQKAYDLGVKARVAFPDDAELARTLGVLAYQRGDYPRAAQLLQDSSQTSSKDGEAIYYLGMAHYQLKRKPESKAELQRALTLNLNAKLAEDAKKTLAELK